MPAYAYYNEFDPYGAQWLKNLIKAGEIADGEVDRRDIKDVRAEDLRDFTQCHFFAGIGGWSYALRLAGWDDTRPVWTGSCPCQPFSTAGKQKGTDDDRHLWPVWFDLIRECRPPVIFGEQVASAIRHGWLDLVFDELEGENYACGAAVLPACGVGAPHLRQRLWFVADTNSRRRAEDHPISERGTERSETEGRAARPVLRGTADTLADSNSKRLGPAGATGWANSEWLPCSDGKARPTQPGICPLADGLPPAMDGRGPISRKGALAGSGNAIVPQVAAEFIRACSE